MIEFFSLICLGSHKKKLTYHTNLVSKIDSDTWNNNEPQLQYFLELDSDIDSKDKKGDTIKQKKLKVDATTLN